MTRRQVERNEDMSTTGVLRIHQQSDGDIIVICERMDVQEMKIERCAVEFCALGAGGGRSPKVRDALLTLMDAIEQDNAERPIAT